MGFNRVLIEDREFLFFLSNDYLGLSSYFEVRQAMVLAVVEYGSGLWGASLICGYTDVHVVFEADLATLKGAEAVLFFFMGYQVNLVVVSVFGGYDMVIFFDAFNYVFIIDGCWLVNVRVEIYVYCDMDDFENCIKGSIEVCRIVVIDEIFSMDGVGVFMVWLVELKVCYGLVLVVDLAHSILVYGKSGSGWSVACGVEDVVDFSVGTLSKAFGC